MNKLLVVLLTLSPAVLFASDANVETDIFQRTVNFVIFAGIIYYLLADKVKAYFAQRSQDIQSELEKVEELKKESALKVEAAQEELDKAKQLAAELIEDAKSDIDSIKNKIAQSIDQEITYLMKNLDEKMDIETKKIKAEVVEEILDQLFSDENIAISQDELSSIILSKVA
jgi:F-type H+-transporting ATPase subunit b